MAMKWFVIKHLIYFQGDTVFRIPPCEVKRLLYHADNGNVVLFFLKKKLIYKFYCMLPSCWCVCVHQVFWSAGGLLEVLLALWLMPTLGWRWLLALSSVPLLIFVCSCTVSIFGDWWSSLKLKLGSNCQMNYLCCTVAAWKSSLWLTDGTHEEGHGNFITDCQRQWQEYASREGNHL